MDKDLDKILADVKSVSNQPEVKAELFIWVSHQMKQLGKALKVARAKLARVSAQVIISSGNKALAIHRDNHERYVTKIESYIEKLEKIHGAVKPKSQPVVPTQQVQVE
jgi:hypothetical protein